MGNFPGRTDKNYVQACQGFLADQISLQKPRLLLVLGAHVPQFLADASDTLAPLAGLNTFKQIDKRGVAAFDEVKIRGCTHGMPMVLLVHPCYRQLNAKYRCWNGFEGEAAETALVKRYLPALTTRS